MSLFSANELSPGPLTSEQVRRTLWMGMCLHSCNFVVGFIGLILSLIFRTSEAEVSLLRALEQQRTSHSCASILLLSTVLLMTSGLLGILSQFLGYPKISTFLIPALAGLAWGIACYGLFEAVVINIGVYHEYLSRSFIRESHNVRQLGRLHSVFHYKTEWDEHLQTSLKCCGIADTKDWFLSPCNCIPPSCCKDTARASYCEAAFTQEASGAGDIATYSELGPSSQKFTNVQEKLWKETCLSKAANVVADMREKWITTMIVVMCLDVWLFLHVTYFCFIVQELYETDGGEDQLRQFKGFRLWKRGLGLERLQVVSVLYNALRKVRRKEQVIRTSPNEEEEDDDSRLPNFEERQSRRKKNIRVFNHFNVIKPPFYKSKPRDFPNIQ